ncbi:ABC transporter ATP-binding protein [Roseicyclus sp. F158]|uniref:ABC transporter ATP-binding protein n=2 Tax=Tropicimonas omnivorans TaxID=3075590 RepID=A0ABU3DMJ7_9RHOB|nr:ABC transporter ATP-binding protein [Roseicyclus sp. F158]MDT0684327.1 ABC transporter ATP-binding protein [Roseicyclus sp. F158]
MTRPILEAQNLRVRYPSGTLTDRLLGRGPRHVTVLPDVSLSVEAGQTLGLIGESGSGKTTLGRAAIGLAPISGGSIRVGDATATSEDAPEWAGIRRRTSMMFQDAVASLDPRMTLGTSVTEPLAIAGGFSGNRRDKAAELLGLVGLSPDFADRYPHQISGGQARRVTVARALALEPDLVIADEPTAGLDLSVQGELLNLLGELQSRLGVSFLFITHNLSVARHVTNRIAIMYLGRIVEEAPTETIFSAPEHPYTRALIGAREATGGGGLIEGDVPSLTRRPEGCEFRTRCPLATDLCAAKAPALREIAPGHTASCHYAGQPAGVSHPEPAANRISP